MVQIEIADKHREEGVIVRMVKERTMYEKRRERKEGRRAQ